MLQPMRKLLSLKNFGIYWNSPAEKLYAELNHEKIKSALSGMILRDKNKAQNKTQYIVAISALCKLVQKNKKDPATLDDAEFDISMSLAPIDVHLKKPQLQDVIHLLEFLNDYTRFKIQCQKTRKISIAHLSEEDLKRNCEEFKSLFTKFRRFENRDGLTGEAKIKAAFTNKQEADRFSQLLMTLNDDSLSEMIKTVLKDLEREKQTKQLVEKKEKRGWFSWGSKKADPDSSQLDESDLENLEKYLEQAFVGKEESNSKISELESKKLLSLKFFLEGGNFYFSDVTAQKNEEGINLFYQELRAGVEISTNSQNINLSLKDYGLSMKTKYSGSRTYIDIPIIRRMKHWPPLESSQRMVSISYELNPPEKDEGRYISLDSQSIEVTFRPAAIQRLQSFFNVSTDDESLKSQAWEQIEKVQDNVTAVAIEAASSQIRTYIDMKLEGPVIIIPFLQNNDLESECWVLNLGDLNVTTKKPVTEDDLFYDRLEIGLRNFRIRYYPSQNLYLKMERSLAETGDLSLLSMTDRDGIADIFYLLEELTVDVEFQKMLVSMEKHEKAKAKPRSHLKITISKIKFNLTPKVYSDLLKTGEFLLPKESVEFVENEKQKLLQGNQKIGLVSVRERRLGETVWTRYFCILKGGYMYFFSHQSDQLPAFNLYIKNSTITVDNTLDRNYCFQVIFLPL